MRDKAFRRHHKIRLTLNMIRKRKLKEVSHGSHWYEGKVEIKKICSCYMCGNFRKFLKGKDKLTLRELKLDKF